MLKSFSLLTPSIHVNIEGFLEEALMMTQHQCKLVEDNIKLVDYVLHRKMNIHENDSNYSDYRQQGMLGLCEAATRYKDSCSKPSTYFVSYIDGYIRTYIRNNSSMLKIPRRLLDVAGQVRSRAASGQSIQDIAASLGVSEKDASDACCAPLSLDADISEDGSSLHEMIEDNHRTEDVAMYEVCCDEAYTSLAPCYKEGTCSRTILYQVYRDISEGCIPNQLDMARRLGCSHSIVNRVQNRFILAVLSNLGHSTTKYNAKIDKCAIECEDVKKSALDILIQAKEQHLCGKLSIMSGLSRGIISKYISGTRDITEKSAVSIVSTWNRLKNNPTIENL